MFALLSNLKTRACCAATVFALLSLTASAEPIKLKFAFYASDREFSYTGIVKPFVDAVNLEGKGVIEIELFPSGALGRTYAQQVQLVLSGAADMAWAHPALTPEQFPDNTVIELPGLFHDAKEATQIYTQVAGAGLLRGYEDFFVVAAMCTEPVNIHSRTPISSLADLKGKKIRSANRTQGTVLKALGMEPVIMPINQVADAINRGVIDGATSGLDVLIDFGISRFASNHYLLGLGCVPLVIVMNRKTFDSLPKTAQYAIRKFSGDQTAKNFVDSIVSYDNQILEKLKAEPKRKVVYPSQEDLATARHAFDSVVAEWANSSPHNCQLLTRVETEIAKLRSTR